MKIVETLYELVETLPKFPSYMLPNIEQQGSGWVAVIFTAYDEEVPYRYRKVWHTVGNKPILA